MQSTVVILTKVPGAAPVKTRLHAALGEEGAKQLCMEMLRATVELALAFDPRPIIAYSPPEACIAELQRTLGACGFLPLQSRTSAGCLAEAHGRADCGRPLLALGGDAPDLPAELVGKALTALADHDMALIPTEDGGFSCLALARLLPGLAEAFRFGSHTACRELCEFAARAGWSTVTLDPWPDVDTPADLERLLSRGWSRAAHVPAVRSYTSSSTRGSADEHADLL